MAVRFVGSTKSDTLGNVSSFTLSGRVDTEANGRIGVDQKSQRGQGEPISEIKVLHHRRGHVRARVERSTSSIIHSCSVALSGGQKKTAHDYFISKRADDAPYSVQHGSVC